MGVAREYILRKAGEGGSPMVSKIGLRERPIGEESGVLGPQRLLPLVVGKLRRRFHPLEREVIIQCAKLVAEPQGFPGSVT